MSLVPLPCLTAHLDAVAEIMVAELLHLLIKDLSKCIHVCRTSTIPKSCGSNFILKEITSTELGFVMLVTKNMKRLSGYRS